MLTVSGCLILLQVQAINFIMCTAIFLRKRKLLLNLHNPFGKNMHGQLLVEVQLRHLSSSNLPQWHLLWIYSSLLFWRHFHFVERRNNTELGNHSITNVTGVVVVCKRSGIRISFQCKRLRIRIL